MPTLNPKLVYLYTAAVVAAVRNRLHSQKALRKGKTGLSRLLKALESSESAHGRRFLMYLRGKTTDSETFLEDYLASKQTDIGPAYAEMIRFYEQAGSKGKAENFQQFKKVAAAQANLIKRYQDHKEDLPAEIYVCQICGFVTTVQLKAKCPVCHAVKEKFNRFDTQQPASDPI